jgi:hypothetical protein
MSQSRHGPPPHCVGCERQKDDCKHTFIGLVCGPCREMLREVVRWQHEARYQRADEQEPAVCRAKIIL